MGDDRAHFEIEILKFNQGTIQKTTHKPTNRLKTRISEDYVKSLHTHTRKHRSINKNIPIASRNCKNAKNKDKKRGNTPKAETLNYQNTQTAETIKNAKMQTRKHTRKQRNATNLETLNRRITTERQITKKR